MTFNPKDSISRICLRGLIYHSKREKILSEILSRLALVEFMGEAWEFFFA